jgi:uncharacterized protein
MFSFPSIGKVVVLITIVLAVWYGFKFIGQLDRQRKEMARRQTGGARSSRGRTASDVEEMIRCRTCGTYIPASGGTSCGKAGCPR